LRHLHLRLGGHDSRQQNRGRRGRTDSSTDGDRQSVVLTISPERATVAAMEQKDFDKIARKIIKENVPGATPVQVEEEGDGLAYALFFTAQTRVNDLRAELPE
jgi:hypothetical protein